MTRDFSPHQKKIIDRYYDRRDEIMVGRLGEIVTELVLAESEAKLNRLWKRAEKAMVALKISSTLIAHILAQRDSELLARHLRRWLDETHRPSNKP